MIPEKIYKIGDKVWYAQTGTKEKTVTCPECLGKRYLTVILGDDTQVTIDCGGCQSGYERPVGYVRYWEWGVDVDVVTIERIEITQEGVEYSFRQCYRAAPDRFFDTKPEAEKRALELAEEHNRDELAKVCKKERANRTWAWNVHYHRGCVRSAEKALVYHKAKLEAAGPKCKEEKKAKAAK